MSSQNQQKTPLPTFISKSVSENISMVHTHFTLAPDLIVKKMVIQQTGSHAALVYMSGLANQMVINDYVLTSLLFKEETKNKSEDLKVLLGHQQEATTWFEIENAIFQGNSVLFVENHTNVFIFNTPGYPQRQVGDSQLEPSLRGSHEGFVETGSQNIAMIRRHLPNLDLKIKEATVGKRGKTKISILYLADVANPEVLQVLEKRIQELDVDMILNTGVLGELIEDNPYSPLPQFIITERPDFAALQISLGRIVTVVDDSPSVLIGPASFTSFFQNIDDYGSRWMVASFIRLLRYVAFFIAVFLPSIYIAVISLHIEVIPLKLLLSIGESRDRVPFPPLLEAFFMEITLEVLRESGLRLPAPIGQSIGIVGGIVIGQAAVEAGIVSNIMVIIVALTAIASFIIPNYDMGSALRIIRFPMMVVASIFGFVGITIGFMIFIGHFIALESLGTPYGSPLAPIRFSEWKDVFIRFPQRTLVNRPFSTRATQLRRAKNNPSKGDKH
ncbi:spore gernimation protein [Peribacillus loiseleuriae]|uniref:Spore gernimation protein n=1 Tax=Peribacillus loiseleuriae TaxID=1679170 RepID=A0A0K9H043_9BACI|nr:spore gernimation protein [Peribacillus loiseleuriae]